MAVLVTVRLFLQSIGFVEFNNGLVISFDFGLVIFDGVNRSRKFDFPEVIQLIRFFKEFLDCCSLIY